MSQLWRTCSEKPEVQASFCQQKKINTYKSYEKLLKKKKSLSTHNAHVFTLCHFGKCFVGNLLTFLPIYRFILLLVRSY